MSNLAAVRNEIKANLTIEGSSQDAAIDGYIRTALRNLRKKRYWFLRRKETLNLAAAASAVSLPTKFSVPEAVNLLYSGTRYTRKTGFVLLDYRDFTENMSAVTKATGKPTSCAINFDSEIETDKVLDKACQVELIYFAQDENLPTNDTDKSVWFDDGYDLVRASAQLLYATFNEGDIDTPATEMTAFRQSLDDRHVFNVGTGQAI